MELVKNIFFNTDKIVENSNVKISYAGYLFEKGSEEVFIHYGFGENWDNVNDVKMEKTELGFQYEINVPETDCLKFCFHNNENEWDNSFGENFSFPVEKVEVEAKVDEVEKTEKVKKAEMENVVEPSVALVSQEDNGMQVHKGLRKSYLFGKKIKLAVYKISRYFKKIVDSNFASRVEDK